jgi:hypothetical protein
MSSGIQSPPNLENRVTASTGDSMASHKENIYPFFEEYKYF